MSPSNPVCRELSIASSFVKQYYTLLNKAPCFIHNFYSNDSTFIHGTIEMANVHYTEPVVGREKIKRKMEDLKLNDCRVKIKQFDCLETLASGLVIQVIGELSNNGKPMRRFLQTFVLAPSQFESARQDGDSQHQQNTRSMGGAASGNNASRGAGVVVASGENNNPSHNQKFFVLNSIFRYQDDGPDNEFEDEPKSGNEDISVAENNVNMSEMNKQLKHSAESVFKPQHHQAHSNSNGAATVSEYSTQNKRKTQLATNDVVATKNVENVEKVVNDLEEGLKLTKSSGIENSGGGEFKSRELHQGPKVVSNGMSGNMDKKNETSEKQSTENGNGAYADSQSHQTISSNNSGSTQIASQQQQPAPSTASTRPQPSNEPKTWANMVRNAHPPSASAVQVNVIKPPSAAAEQQHQNVTQPSSVQAHQHPHHHQQQQQPQSSQQPQQQLQPSQQQQQQQQQQNRRRHMMRKPSNKSTGRSIKNRPPPRPPQATTNTNTGTKPVA